MYINVHILRLNSRGYSETITNILADVVFMTVNRRKHRLVYKSATVYNYFHTTHHENAIIFIMNEGSLKTQKPVGASVKWRLS